MSSSNPAAQAAGVLSFQQARHAVEEQAARLRATESEPAELLYAAGRILAEDVAADRDLPPFPRSARDGYALRAADLASLPARLKVVGSIRAGIEPEAMVGAITSGQAAEIMTGAPAPPGADAVVMVEYTARQGDTVEVQRAVHSGDNIVPLGSEARRGQTLLKRGTPLTPAAIAAAASVGKSQLLVYKLPRVAILSTGDEVVQVAAEPGPYQIRNSNAYSLAAQVTAAGGDPVLLPIAPDDPVRLQRLLAEGLAADLLLITGGVSVGKHDYVEQVLASFQAEFFFTGVEIQPGRPLVFGRAARREAAQPTYFFGLPGNPVSTLVTFELFARPVVEALAGAVPRKLVFLQARLKTEVRTKTGLTRFFPALLSGEFERADVERVNWQGSGDVVSTAQANCWLVIPPDRDRLPAGEMVSVIPFRG